MGNDSLQEDIWFARLTAPAPAVAEGTLERARLRDEYFAHHAAATSKIRGFRRRVVAQTRPRAQPDQPLSSPGGSEVDAAYATVSAEAARRFLASPAVAVMSTEEFGTLGVPLFDHTSQVSRMNFLDGAVWLLVEFVIPDWDPFAYTLVYPIWPGAPLERSGHEGVESPRPGSILDELHQLATWLTREFPWDLQDAIWFVLTGEPPMRPLIETSVNVRKSTRPQYTDARVTLTVDATLSPDEVSSHYGRVRDQLLGGTGIRHAEERTLAVFRFVTIQRIQHPASTWGELVREWDRICPEPWRFDGNEKTFRLYSRRGLRSVFPEFRPVPTGQPAPKEQT
jgi:hypothetical protein